MYQILYAIWILIPLVFFTLALWSKLEGISGKQKKDNPADLIRQGLFVSGCVIVAILIDQYLLTSLYQSFSPEWIPFGFYEVLLLPLILFLAAQFIGPSKSIRITKAPRPSDQAKKK